MMEMSFQDWPESRRFRPHKTDSREIAQLLAAADRDLADAQVQGLSADRRFATAYSAALLAATAALAASGYQSPQEGHHYWTVQSLAFTVYLAGNVIQRLDRARKKRNIGDYEMMGMVSQQEVGEILSLAQQLRATVEKWLHEHYPDLMGATDAGV